jgi:hypothetical protein
LWKIINSSLKKLNMKFKSFIIAAGIAVPCLVFSAFLLKKPLVSSLQEIKKPAIETTETPKACCKKEIITPIETPKGCVFKTLMGEDKMAAIIANHTPAQAQIAIDSALLWMQTAQLADGGWSANSTVSPNVKQQGQFQLNQVQNQPSTIETSDPASTAMVCMALLRCLNTPTQGIYASQLNKGIEFLLKTTEQNEQLPYTNTTITNTQPQRKLGANIDNVLTAQFLSNLLNYVTENDPKRARIKKCLEICVQKIQKTQADNGSFQGSGWAGVLQSSFSNNALESAQTQGIQVDQKILDKSREYQQSNYDLKTDKVNTEMGAGVLLYSVSSSSRASAQEARKAKETIEKAQNSGKLSKKEDVSVENLKKAGLNEAQAMKYATAYQVNGATKTSAQDNKVMTGYGNNGGEEFLSYLQTGEGLIIAKDDDWKTWYNNISGTLLGIQNADGSWNGHHCITSPVFCTATCLLVLSVQNDISNLQK